MLMLVLAGVNGQDRATIYQTYCTGCHGAQMRGSLGDTADQNRLEIWLARDDTLEI